VFKALDQLTGAGEEISVSSVARAAGVHRSLIHRLGDCTRPSSPARAGPHPGTTAGTQVSRKSLLADVANLTARNGRLSAHITRLERRLSKALGQTDLA
jgi:transposase-like protein